MSKLYICDKCGKKFKQPLDEVRITVGNKFYVLDLCAVCRKKIDDEIRTYRINKLKKLIKEEE